MPHQKVIWQRLQWMYLTHCTRRRAEPRDRETDRQTLRTSVTIVCIACIPCSAKTYCKHDTKTTLAGVGNFLRYDTHDFDCNCVWLVVVWRRCSNGKLIFNKIQPTTKCTHKHEYETWQEQISLYSNSNWQAMQNIQMYRCRNNNRVSDTTSYVITLKCKLFTHTRTRRLYVNVKVSKKNF